jgi:hypothetical protein
VAWFICTVPAAMARPEVTKATNIANRIVLVIFMGIFLHFRMIFIAKYRFQVLVCCDH